MKKIFSIDHIEIVVERTSEKWNESDVIFAPSNKVEWTQELIEFANKTFTNED